MLGFKRELQVKRGLNNLIFFNWFSNLKNLVLWNGSKNEQKVIEMVLKQLFFPRSLIASG